MGALEDLTAAVSSLSSRVGELAAEVAELRAKVAPSREVYTLHDLAELPESPSLKSLQNRRELQPNGGQADGFRGSQKAWYRATVEAWRRELAPRPDAPAATLKKAV
ncbi:MAG: hypothetical protein ABSB63_21870 [Spirochaetia bacterium]